MRFGWIVFQRSGFRSFGAFAYMAGCGSDMSRANPLQLSNFAHFWILLASA